MSAGARPYRRAVVIGAGIAGLAAAQALSTHFRRVTVVERDALADRPEHRAGAPWAQHLHVLLGRDDGALDRLLPGYADGLFEAGAVAVDVPTDLLWQDPMGGVRRIAPAYRLLSTSRGLVEWYTRRRVSDSASVRIIDRCNAVDLRLSEDRTRVEGVCVARNGGEHPEWVMVESIDADLVVDATGRRSRLPAWLERLGFERPAETRIDADVSYATMILRRPAAAAWKATCVQAHPPRWSRLGALFPIEHDRWIVVLRGVGADRPPTSEDGFAAFAAALGSPAIYEAITRAEPLTEAVGWAHTADVWRHYERATLPDRLLAVGGGACAFDPVYGPGIAVAAASAIALGAELARLRPSPLDGFTAPTQKLLSDISTSVSGQNCPKTAVEIGFGWWGRERSGTFRACLASGAS